MRSDSGRSVPRRREGWDCRVAIIATFLFVAPTLLPASRAAAEAWSGVTLVTASGWEYAGVDVEASADGSEVTIVQPDGARKRMSRANVRVILDPTGKDITSVVFANVAPPAMAAPPATRAPQGPAMPPPYVPERTVDRSAVVPGPRYRVLISVTPGLGIAGGDWYEGMNQGASVSGSLRIVAADAVYFGVRYRYQKLGVDDTYLQAFYVVDDYGNPVALDMKVHLNQIYGLVGFQTTPLDYRSPFAFFEVGFGGIAHHIDMAVPSSSTAGVVGYDETKLGVLFAGGGVIPFGRSVGLEIQTDMQITGSGDSNQYDLYDTSTTGYLFGIGVGLAWLIGG